MAGRFTNPDVRDVVSLTRNPGMPVRDVYKSVAFQKYGRGGSRLEADKRRLFKGPK